MRRSCMFFVLSFLLNYASSESCITPLGQRSQCITLFECNALLPAFSLRPIPTNIVNFLRQSQCGFQENIPKVCCGPLPPDTTPSTLKPDIEDDADPVSREDSYPAPQDNCGVDAAEGDRIYGGRATDVDEFPWMALLGYRTRNGTITYQCGGVLINRRYVLTAAHCVTGAIEQAVGQLATVRLGEYNIQMERDCVDTKCADPPQNIRVQTAYPNIGYSDNNKNRKDDIALIRLAKRATISNFVSPICLVENNARLLTGAMVFVAGWGKTLDGHNSPVKQKLDLPIFDKNECVEKYRRFSAELTQGQLCAGGLFAQDACRGDSGGPLMRLRNTGVWETIAIVSFGYGCGRDGWPGVYTNVAHYRDWIQATMQASNV